MAAIDWGMYPVFHPKRYEDCAANTRTSGPACGDATALGAIRRSVIIMSIGGPAYQPLDDMLQKAYEQGMVIVVAASNYNADACGYSPARSPNATTVAAIDQSDSRPDWSNCKKLSVFVDLVSLPPIS